MDAKETIATLCYNAIKNRLQGHLEVRDASFGMTYTIYMKKATRAYQHFQICLVVNLHARHVYGETTQALLFDCYYNIKGDLQVFIKLNDEDPFEGAADFDIDYGRCRHFLEDIIRSFFDATPTYRLAILKI